MNLYLGWDVGGWNCDRNRNSRDARCALTDTESCPVLAGHSWRGNVREVLCSDQPIDGLLALIDITVSSVERIVVAIDTPLTWPGPALALLTGGETARVPPTASQNPYLFRPAEMFLTARGKQALSPVRDMIGSQSLKGIHFLSVAGARRVSVGVWQSDRAVLTAIECYPAPCRQSAAVQRVINNVRLDDVNEDVRDALCAAAIAWLFWNNRTTLVAPPNDFPNDEGWIWVTSDSLNAYNLCPCLQNSGSGRLHA